jgi:hypothetical protein
MPLPPAFDGFVEHTKRVSPTCLISFERNRYSVPASFANRPVSLRVYPDRLVVVLEARLWRDAAEGQILCEHVRVIQRSHQIPPRTIYDWRHYLAVLQRTRNRRVTSASTRKIYLGLADLPVRAVECEQPRSVLPQQSDRQRQRPVFVQTDMLEEALQTSATLPGSAACAISLHNLTHCCSSQSFRALRSGKSGMGCHRRRARGTPSA